jgi:sulfopyruvate decarboxylase subunit beta
VKLPDCFAHLAGLWCEELVICATGTACREWYAATESDRAFYMRSSMGLASSIGLGLALGLPQQKVWVLNGDGGLSMNLSTLLTEANKQPPNMVHFLLSNRVYQVLAVHPLGNAARTDFGGLARAAGIEHVYTFSELDDFRAGMEDILNASHYSFVVLDVEAERRPKPEIAVEGPEIKYRFGRYIEKQAGVSVFGPAGY